MTESFTLDPDYQSLEPGTGWRVHLKTLLAGLALFGGVVLIYNGLLQALYTVVDMNKRMQMQIDYAAELLNHPGGEKKMVVYGSSMVQAGFEPTLFDRLIAEQGGSVVSFNYGIGNLNPRFQALMTRRIRDGIEASGGQLDLALVEFNPFQATKRRDAGAFWTADQNVALLSTPGELLDITLADPTRGVRLFNIRYLRDGYSAELFTTIPALIMDDPVYDESSVEYQEARRRVADARARFDELRGEAGPVQQGDRWDLPLRGGRMDKRHYSPEALAALSESTAGRRHPLFMAADLQRRIDGADILELDFEEELIVAFLEMVENFKAVSERVEVILLPRNTEWVQYSPQARARLASALDRIERETGVRVRNLQTHPEITPEHFIDTTHLSASEGIDVFTTVLAELYGPELVVAPPGRSSTTVP